MDNYSGKHGGVFICPICDRAYRISDYGHDCPEGCSWKNVKSAVREQQSSTPLGDTVDAITFVRSALQKQTGLII